MTFPVVCGILRRKWSVVESEEGAALVTPHVVLICMAGIGAITGFASLLHSSEPLTIRGMSATVLYSASFAFGIGALSMEQFGNRPYYLFGAAALSGLGGVQFASLVISTDWKGILLRMISSEKKPGDPQV